MANNYKMRYAETSAKSGFGVNEVFEDLLNTFVSGKIEADGSHSITIPK